jgi:glycosyltransferase involved in cell wall biosynthesis
VRTRRTGPRSFWRTRSQRARAVAYDRAVRVLFLHQNFPGQYKHLAPALAARGDEVRALAITPRGRFNNVTIATYAVGRAQTSTAHGWAQDFETKCIRAEACMRALVAMKREGFEPDVVVGHPGWGETWLVKEVWPDVPLLAYQEFYFREVTGFDPEFHDDSIEQRARVRLKNGSLLLGLEGMDWGVCPTQFQYAQLPDAYKPRVSVVFDGIDTDHVRPDPSAFIELGGGKLRLTAADEVVSFINRNLEPSRGYHTFMRALPALQRLRPRARVIIVGGDEPGYGPRPPAGTSWRDVFLREVHGQLDLSRVHFVGRIPYGTLLSLMRVATCHVYLTTPFVLSWSTFEAMSAGALVVGSRTAPVEEVVQDGENGLLTDFFDPKALAERVASVLAEPRRYDALRAAARETIVRRYDLRRVCLPRHVALVDAVQKRAFPPALPEPWSHPA